MLKAVIGNIKLDKNTHMYSIDGFTPENQISVSSLARGCKVDNLTVWLQQKMAHGIAIHDEVDQYLFNKIDQCVLPESKGIIDNLTSIYPPNENNKIFSDVSFGVYDSDYDLYVFGTPDLIIWDGDTEYSVIEFKSGDKVQSYHTDQVNLYKYLIAMEMAAHTGNESLVILDKISAAVITPAEVKLTTSDNYDDFFKSKLKKYHEKTNVVEIDSNTEAEILYEQIQNMKKKLKELEEKFDSILEENVPPHTGQFSWGKINISRITYTTTTYDKNLIQDKCPEAIIQKLAQRTTIRGDV
jgi:hypothetical protein